LQPIPNTNKEHASAAIGAVMTLLPTPSVLPDWLTRNFKLLSLLLLIDLIALSDRG